MNDLPSLDPRKEKMRGNADFLRKKYKILDVMLPKLVRKCFFRVFSLEKIAKQIFAFDKPSFFKVSHMPQSHCRVYEVPNDLSIEVLLSGRQGRKASIPFLSRSYSGCVQMQYNESFAVVSLWLYKVC